MASPASRHVRFPVADVAPRRTSCLRQGDTARVPLIQRASYPEQEVDPRTAVSCAGAPIRAGQQDCAQRTVRFTRETVLLTTAAVGQVADQDGRHPCTAAASALTERSHAGVDGDPDRGAGLDRTCGSMDAIRTPARLVSAPARHSPAEGAALSE